MENWIVTGLLALITVAFYIAFDSKEYTDKVKFVWVNRRTYRR